MIPLKLKLEQFQITVDNQATLQTMLPPVLAALLVCPE
jgi:hypothetical protein